MADPISSTTSRCWDCYFWQQRQGGVGWCDLSYPEVKRGLKKANDTCGSFNYLGGRRWGTFNEALEAAHDQP